MRYRIHQGISLQAVRFLARHNGIVSVSLGRDITFHFDNYYSICEDGEPVYRCWGSMSYSEYFKKTIKIWVRVWRGKNANRLH